MRMSKIASLCLIGSAAFIIGCGGGTGSGSDTNSSTKVETGTFVDAPVAGLEYNTSSGIIGITDSSGHFQYNKGDKIIFKLGSVTFPSVSATNTITPMTITENNTTKATNVAYILQNLNTGNNSKIIKLPSHKILKEVVKDINLSNDTNVSNCIKNIKPIIEQNLDIKLPNVTVTEAKNQMFNNIDNIIKNLIVGKTYYIPVTDVSYKHVEKLQFQEDGKLIDSWMEKGKQYKGPFDYVIKDGKLHISGINPYGDNGNEEINTYFSLKDIQNELYETYEQAYKHLNDNQNDLKLVKDLVSGKVIFVDENGSQIQVPENANIRFTPKKYQVDGNWSAVNCKIESDGNFGNECYIDGDMNENDMKNALLNEKVQIIVYKDENNNFKMDENEKSYFGEENVTLNNLNDIQINATINNINNDINNDINNENNKTITLDKFKQILSQKGLKPIEYNLTGKTIVGDEEDNGDDYDIVYFNNSTVKYYGYDEDNLKLDSSNNNTYTIINGIYEGNDSSYFAPVSKNGDVITAVGYDDSFWKENFLVLNGDVTNTKITEDNVKSFFSNTNFVNVSDSDLEGTWKTGDNDPDKVVFDKGNFSFTDISTGENDGKGTYTVNNGVITLKWNSGEIDYVLPAEKSDKTLKVYVIVTNSDGYLRGGEIHTLTKQ